MDMSFANSLVVLGLDILDIRLQGPRILAGTESCSYKEDLTSTPHGTPVSFRGTVHKKGIQLMLQAGVWGTTRQS